MSLGEHGFWDLIELVDRAALADGDDDGAASALSTALSERPVDDIFEFEERLAHALSGGAGTPPGSGGRSGATGTGGGAVGGSGGVIIGATGGTGNVVGAGGGSPGTGGTLSTGGTPGGTGGLSGGMDGELSVDSGPPVPPPPVLTWTHEGPPTPLLAIWGSGANNIVASGGSEWSRFPKTAAFRSRQYFAKALWSRLLEPICGRIATPRNFDLVSTMRRHRSFFQGVRMDTVTRRRVRWVTS
jgi:hypothetical protein